MENTGKLKLQKEWLEKLKADKKNRIKESKKQQTREELLKKYF